MFKVNLEENSFFPETSKTIFPLKLNEEESGLFIKMTSSDVDLNNITWTVIIFQDSYDNMFKKISSEQRNIRNFLMNDSLLTALPADHNYIVEVYLEGRFLTAFQDYFTQNEVIEENILISESAEIRFKVVDKQGVPQENVTIKNWIYSAVTDETGFTDWIDVMPTSQEKYSAKAIFRDESVTWSESFNVDNNERKVIQIMKGERNDAEN